MDLDHKNQTSLIYSPAWYYQSNTLYFIVKRPLTVARNEIRMQIHNWCNNNCEEAWMFDGDYDRYRIDAIKIYFYSKLDAANFKLAWL